MSMERARIGGLVDWLGPRMAREFRGVYSIRVFKSLMSEDVILELSMDRLLCLFPFHIVLPKHLLVTHLQEQFRKYLRVVRLSGQKW